MKYTKLKDKLNSYYLKQAPLNAEKLQEECYSVLDKFFDENPKLNNYELKSKQYSVITENIEPVLFDDMPFYFETGALHPYSDGHFLRGMRHANGWLIEHNRSLPQEENREMYESHLANIEEQLICSNDIYMDLEHFKLPFKKILKKGLKGVYDEACAMLSNCESEEERDFINCAMQGLLSLKQISEKFSDSANEKLKSTTDEKQIKTLKLIADTAKRVPWNKPETVYEGLETLAFMRKVLGSIEGIGYASMGRVDVLLAPLYENDKKNGVSDEEIYELICKFLSIWDSHVDKNKKMEGYADYEYENGITVGGCDENGNEVFNKITKFFLEGHFELDNMYPKIKCRYSVNSSEEYLALINRPILNQKSILLYCNDDAIIPAIERHGFDKNHAMDYTVTGCWDVSIDDYYKAQGGQYVNTLKAVEWAMHMPKDKLARCGLSFKSIADCKTFDEVYDNVLHNILEIIKKKAQDEAEGTRNWSRIAPFCVTSALMYGPLEKRRDYTNGGSTYNWENMFLTAFPDTIDSLLAIKTLCFDKKVCTINELIDACKNNWQDKSLRGKALNSPFYGDGSEESAKMLAKITEDIYVKTRNLPSAYGGQWQIGSYMYTEIIWWGKNILATPNGRFDGDMLSQGFTPSRLHKIKSVTDVFAGLKYFDYTLLSQGAVINVVLPASKMNEKLMNAFLRGCASSKASILQINCVNKEDLLAAQKDPEKYDNIIVRVCGFSAQFITLSKDYQDEFLSRNFYLD